MRPFFVAVVLLSALAGCADAPEGPVPAGPGAASSKDLSTWVQEAETVTIQGQLLYLSVASDHGIYFTWSVNPKGPMRPVEVDVRACGEEFKRLENQQVILVGKFIDRQPRHLPLVVATHILEMPRDAQLVQIDECDDDL